MANGIGQRFAEYRPSKGAWFWSIVGTVVVVLILGFTWGGWVTGGTAEEMAEDAATDARTQLAAALCVNQFMQEPDARTQLASLKEESWYSRDRFVVEGGWAKLPTEAIDEEDVAEACAEQLAEMEMPAATAEAGDAGTAVQ
jgi:hypothetical protein